MRRIIMVVAVALVMAAMVLAMAMPVFAQEVPETLPGQVCAGPADNRSPVIRESPTEPTPTCRFNPGNPTPSG
jgi:hypothetical protein